MVSTDKACSPINVYGMCKSLAERIVLEKSRNSNVTFCATRYGNVLESRGSIIPLFLYQAKNKKEFTITHKKMTRFLMTLDDSVDLIVDALNYAQHGDTFVPNLASMKIMDLAEIFSSIYNKPIKVTGIRVGEKLHESLINETESLRTQFIPENDRFIISPA